MSCHCNAGPGSPLSRGRRKDRGDDGRNHRPRPVWNYAHVLRDQGVPYQAYISQISYLLFLKMDEERAGLAAYGIKDNSAIPAECRWAGLSRLPGESLTTRESEVLDGL